MLKPSELDQMFKMMEHNRQQYERFKDYPGTVQQAAMVLSFIEEGTQKIKSDYEKLYHAYMKDHQEEPIEITTRDDVGARYEYNRRFAEFAQQKAKENPDILNREVIKLWEEELELDKLETRILKEVDRIVRETKKEPLHIIISSEISEEFFGKSIKDITNRIFTYIGIRVFESTTLKPYKFIVIGDYR